VEKGTLIHCWWECKLVQPLWKKIWKLLKNLNIDLPYDPAIPLLRIYLKECNTDYSRGTCTPMFIAALFTIVKLRKQPRCPILTTESRKCGIYTQWNFSQP
jgi:Fe-S-cluster containining protein